MQLISNEVLFTNPFAENTLSEDRSIAIIRWNELSKTMKDDDFKNYLLAFVDAMEKTSYSIKGILVDASAKLFVMKPDVQAWHDEVIIPKYIQLGIRKMAFVIPSSIFVEMSISQTFEEENSQAINTKFFDKESDATNFLLG